MCALPSLTLGRHQFGHALTVVDVHLAAERLDGEGLGGGLGHGGGLYARAAAGARVGGYGGKRPYPSGAGGTCSPFVMSYPCAFRTDGVGSLRQFSTCRSAVILNHPVPYPDPLKSEEHTSELQSLMRISYAVFCLKKNKSKT